MATATKPTIVLVTGAWHSPSHYSILLSRLQAAGYPTICSRLPSVNPVDPSTATTAQDAAFIRSEMLLPLIDAGKDVLMIIHSYGGIPGSAAATGLSKIARVKEGKKGGIIGLVLIVAFLAKEGDSLSKVVGGQIDDWIKVDPEHGTGTIPDPIPLLYGDVSSTTLAAQAASTLLPHGLLSFGSPSPAPAWQESVYDGRRAYIRCTEDKAVPDAKQRGFLEYSAVEWEVEVLEAGHSPILSRPGEVEALVVGWAEKWMA